MSWPSGSDPWYLANPTDNNARRSYYGVNATPTMKCDGYSASWTAIQSAIQSRLAVPSPLWMDLNGSVNGQTLNVTCRVVANTNISGNYAIQFTLLERYRYLQSPNGQPHHYHPLLAFAPSASGQSFSAVANDTATYTASFSLNSAWSLDNLDFAAFVQNNTTKEILQAALKEMPLDFPNLLLTEYTVSDPTGNGDGRVDPGETGEMVITLANQVPFHDAEQVAATLSTSEPLIQVTVATVSFPDIPAGSSASNDNQPFQFYVDPAFEAHEVSFTVTVTAQPGSYQSSYPVTFMVGRPDILLVNDDVNGNYQSFYDGDLNSLGRVHDAWNQSQAGLIPESELSLYPIVIWYTGSDAQSVLTAEEQSRIENYLNGGGRLFLSSQNAGDVLGATGFYQNVLHAQHLANTVSEMMIDGVPGDPISGGTTLFMAGSGGAGNGNSSSSLNPLDPAVGIYTYPNAGSRAALRCETGGYKLVYMAFAFEAVTGAAGTTSRVAVLENILDWLVSTPVEGRGDFKAALPNRVAIQRISPNPFNPNTTIEFALPKNSSVQVAIYDLGGRLLNIILQDYRNAGQHRVLWNAEDLPSGIYLIRIVTPYGGATSKAVLLK
jgi:hypothetical protein